MDRVQPLYEYTLIMSAVLLANMPICAQDLLFSQLCCTCKKD